MTGRRSSARQTRSEAREEFLRRAAKLWDEFTGWHDDHPEATFDDLEAELGKRRRVILGDFLVTDLRRGDLGATPEPPSCPQCGRPMVFKGYPEKEVHGLESDVELPRAYYVCVTCTAGFFPPGMSSPSETG